MNYINKPNLKVHFFLRGAETCKNENQSLSVYCQLEMEGYKRDTPFSTNIKVPLCHWWTHQGLKQPFGKWVSEDYYLSDIANRNLQHIERTLLHISEILTFQYNNGDLTYNLIRERFHPKTQKIRDAKRVKPVKCFFEVMEEMKNYRAKKKQLRNQTLKTYKTRKKNIEEYFQSIKNTNIKITEIKRKVIDDFELWMIESLNEDGTERFSRNYRNKHITFIRQILDFALDREYIEYMPIGKLNLEYDQEKPPNYLLPIQRKSIENCKEKGLEKVRDIAIFLMNTGFSYIDYLNLTSEHLIGDGFKKQRHKTDVFCLPPLLPKAKSIIEKYGGIENLPKPDDADLNKDLKYLGIVCGLTEETVGFNLKTSDFRETFCSMLENELMFGERPLMAAMGHKNPKQLRSYSRMMPQRVLYELKKQQEQMDRLGIN